MKNFKHIFEHQEDIYYYVPGSGLGKLFFDYSWVWSLKKISEESIYDPDESENLGVVYYADLDAFRSDIPRLERKLAKELLELGGCPSESWLRCAMEFEETIEKYG